MHAALHKPAAGNQGHKRCLRQTLAFTSLSARPVLVTASQPLLHMHTASSWLELPLFLPCTDFMPFKLCWQRTWLFLLTAAASSGPMLLFTEKPVFPKTSRASCCDARTVETVAKMCRGQSCWQPVSVSVQVAYQIQDIRWEKTELQSIWWKEKSLLKLYLYAPREDTCQALAVPFPLTSDPGLF